MEVEKSCRQTPLSARERAAVMDCASFPSGTYTWSPGTMRKLVARGLAQQQGEHAVVAVHVLTASGVALVETLAKEDLGEKRKGLTP